MHTRTIHIVAEMSVEGSARAHSEDLCTLFMRPAAVASILRRMLQPHDERSCYSGYSCMHATPHMKANDVPPLLHSTTA